MKRLLLVSILALASAQAAAQPSGQGGSVLSGFASGGDPDRAGARAGAGPPPFHNVPPTTAIVPDVDPARTLDTTVTQTGPVYLIDGGRLAGRNLFHSFAAFDLATGDIARWQFSSGDPSSLDNVVNRVTGGSPSFIYGTIDSSGLPNADFWFINPAGIVFGAGAVLDVPAAAHFSTASELRFGSGPAFAVAAPDGSTLSVANPVAFGFLGAEGAILVDLVDNGFVPNMGALSLTASDIAIADSSFNAGSLALAATGGMAAAVGPDSSATRALAGQVYIVASAAFTQSSALAGGDIRINSGTLALDLGSSLGTVAGTDIVGGSILIASNEVAMFNSGLATVTFGDSAAGAISLTATNLNMVGSFIQSTSGGIGNVGSVTIATSGNVAMSDASFISADSYGDADSGGVVVAARNLSMSEVSFISSDARADGHAGGVVVAVDDRLEMSDGAYISSDSLGSGNGGSVLVAAGDVALSGDSFISSAALSTGNGGNVSLSVINDLILIDSHIDTDTKGTGLAGDVFVSSGYLGLIGSYISSDAVGAGSAGNVTVQAGSADLLASSYIASDIYDFGIAGTIDVDVAGTLLLEDGSAIRSNVGNENFRFASGPAGDVLVTAGEILLADGSYISSDVWGDGSGGSVVIGADLLRLDSGAYISSDSLGFGDAGEIQIFAGSAQLSGGSFIASDVYGEGNGGSVEVEVSGTLELSDQAAIRSLVHPLARGNGGAVFVSADRLLLDTASGISTDALGFGDAGIITVEANDLQLAGASYISSDSKASGEGGDVLVTASSATLLGGSYISSNALSEGNGGIVQVEVGGLLRMEGASISSDSLGSGDAGGAIVAAGDADLFSSRISSDANGSGDGGAALVSVTNLLSLDQSRISSDSQGPGDAGGVFVDARDARLVSGSAITSNALGDGAGGVVSVEIANELRLRSGSFISSDVGGAGDAGNVLVSARRLDLAEGSFVSSDTLGGSTGDALQVVIRASDLFMASDSYISSDAIGSGDAGFVDIEAAARLDMTGAAFISSSTYGAGDAGFILVSGGTATLIDSAIATNAFASGNAQSIAIEVDSLSLVRSQIVSETSGSGRSGTIDISAGLLELLDGSNISTRSLNPNPAGVIAVAADRLRMTGAGSTISSENFSALGGDAGTIFLLTGAGGATISEGARITTNSTAGVAGNIVFDMLAGSLLILEGRTAPGALETSSGPGQGGQIFIANPFAIISNGGNILALGQSGGANVLIDTNYFIASADRLNRVEVDGVLEFSNAIYDVSAGTVNPDLSVLDASGVLRGQCPAIRSTGEISQMIVRETGPYGSVPPPQPPSPDTTAQLGSRVSGACS